LSASQPYRPLYRQVRDILLERIGDGVWRPGEPLPSEQALARDLGVSQGTVRKVLDALTAEGLVERRQGKGTFIAENTQGRSLFRFFRMARRTGERVIPERLSETVRLRAARAIDQKRLDLDRGARVVEINRIRTIDGLPAVLETIVVPALLVPGLETRRPLPNTLYSLYQSDYHLNIVSAQEDLHPDLATTADARDLGIPAGSPVLCVDRIAYALPDTKVEWRLSRIASRDLVYTVTLN
jgi:GntR family transcriptional regulator